MLRLLCCLCEAWNAVPLHIIVTNAASLQSPVGQNQMRQGNPGTAGIRGQDGHFIRGYCNHFQITAQL